MNNLIFIVYILCCILFSLRHSSSSLRHSSHSFSFSFHSISLNPRKSFWFQLSAEERLWWLKAKSSLSDELDKFLMFFCFHISERCSAWSLISSHHTSPPPACCLIFISKLMPTFHLLITDYAINAVDSSTLCLHEFHQSESESIQASFVYELTLTSSSIVLLSSSWRRQKPTMWKPFESQIIRMFCRRLFLLVSIHHHNFPFFICEWKGRINENTARLRIEFIIIISSSDVDVWIAEGLKLKHKRLRWIFIQHALWTFHESFIRCLVNVTYVAENIYLFQLDSW